jgi:ATP synthase F1 epsilon subunit
MTIRCEIVSQDRTVFQGDVDIVILPGAAGEMGILPHHAPVLAILKYGVIKIRHNGKEELFTVAGGMAEVQPDIVTILADAAENIEAGCQETCGRCACSSETGRPGCLSQDGSCPAALQPASGRCSSLSQDER